MDKEKEPEFKVQEEHLSSQALIPFDIEERREKAYDLKIKGFSASSIANTLGVSTATIRSDFKALGKRYREMVLDCDPLDLMVENLSFLDEMERVALFEFAASSNRVQMQQIKNPKTGKIEKIEVEISDPNKAKYFSQVLKAREMKLRLLMDMGVLTKDDPTKLFKQLGQFEEHQTTLEEETRTREDIDKSIEQLLKRGQLIQ